MFHHSGCGGGGGGGSMCIAFDRGEGGDMEEDMKKIKGKEGLQ